MSSSFRSTLKKSKSFDVLSVTNEYAVKREKSFERFCDYFTSDNRSQSGSSQNICVLIDDRSELSSTDGRIVPEIHDEGLSILDYKITKLNNMLQEQHNLLQALKKDLFGSNCGHDLPEIQQPDLLKSSSKSSEDVTKLVSTTFDGANMSPDCILETKIDNQIREALIDFLKSDDLKTHIASATAESMKEVISKCFSESFPSVYLPAMEQSHRKLLLHVTKTLEKAFNELEAGSSSLYRTVYKTSHTLRAALEKHQVDLESSKAENIFESLQGTLETILKDELKEWRGKVLGVIKPQILIEEYEKDAQDYDIYKPICPPQPAVPELSIIDQLMKSAEIKRQISEGDVNESFQLALSSSDLSLVVAACRAAEPARVFSPCRLSQAVLLSLVQQLATDMVHDTQLKCRYLEEAIINLKTSDRTTRQYLPLVVGEVRKHLTKFLKSFPCHVASRRIHLIIMAANNLLK